MNNQPLSPLSLTPTTLAAFCTAPSHPLLQRSQLPALTFIGKRRRGGALLLTPRQRKEPSKSRIRCLHGKGASSGNALCKKGRPNANLSPQAATCTQQGGHSLILGPSVFPRTPIGCNEECFSPFTAHLVTLPTDWPSPVTRRSEALWVTVYLRA